MESRYDEYVARLLIPLAEKVLERVDVEPRMQFPDVEAGPDTLTVATARRGAHVVADLAPDRITRLEARVRSEALATWRPP